MLGLGNSSLLASQVHPLLMPGRVCVWGTFEQIQVAAQLSVQLKCCYVCAYGLVESGHRAGFLEAGYAALPLDGLGLGRCCPSKGRN